MVCWFSGWFLKAFRQILYILRNYGWAMSITVAFVDICHTSCLPKFGHQMLNCPSVRYIVPAKISPALSLFQKYWFFGKVRVNDFYPLLRSIASSAVYTTWKIWKKIVKHNFRMKNKIGRLFWTTLYIFRIEFMFMWLVINLLILAMCFAFNFLRKNMFSLLSLFSSIKLIILVDDCSRQEHILLFGFLILASEHLY